MEEDRLSKEQAEQAFNELVIKNFIEYCNHSIKYCNDLYNYAKRFDLLDTQLFIQWQDALNEISVRYDSRDSTSQDSAE